MKNITVIGDVHGCFLTMKALVEKIQKEYPEDEIIFVGDLIDRGPKSKEVVQYIIDNKFKSTVGNHEQMMMDDMLCPNPEEYPYHSEWLIYHAGATLSSYQKDGNLDGDLLIKHAQWMTHLPYYIEFKDVKNDRDQHLVVSHASIGSTWKFRHPDSEKHHFFQNEVMWNRAPPEEILGVYNIFGHTPEIDGVRIKSYFANVDTGACLKREWSENYGVLSALRFPSMEVIQQKNIEND